MNPMNVQCPVCQVTLRRYEWSKLWWLSSSMSGRLVHPCSHCGSLLRLSAMRVFTALGALGLLGTAIARFLHSDSPMLLVLALMFAVLTWVGMACTRVEVVRRLVESGASDGATTGSAWER